MRTLPILAFLATGLACTPQITQAETPKGVAFLDKPNQIRVWLEKPLAPEAMKGLYRVRINGREVPVRSVQAGGDPEAVRILPRTPGRVILPGTLQSALGGKEWDPDGETTQMTEVAPGVFELVVELPKGNYQYKVARNGGWGENWGVGFAAGGGNLSVNVPADGTVVKFVVDFNRKVILNSISNPNEVQAPATAPARPKPEGPTTFPVAVLELGRDIRPDEVDEDIQVIGPDRRRVIARDILTGPVFKYDGALGSIWGEKQTEFKVWSPVSKRATVLLFDQAEGGAPRRLPMRMSRNGVWTVAARGDLHGKFYQYEFESYGEVRLATDINSFSANKASTRSMVVDLSRTNPEGWGTVPQPRLLQPTDAVIYELHVRDFTVREDSGVDAAKRGKYAGMVQRGTTVPGTNFKTGLDYMVDLGVTDIHILPVQNFLLSHEGDYTWGYATNLFNVPEESYSMTPNDPVGVIREFKTMVQEMHRAGLRVVMDVVYNHTWPPEGKDSAFWQTVPYYYFRTNDRGDVLNESGVGNALADERPMARKYVRDSVTFWVREYRIDGYRFDLLGMHRPESVRDWSAAIRAIRPDATLYGEPWTGGGPTYFPKGAQRGTRFALFNDRFRGAFRGELDGNAPGFIMGGGSDRGFLEKAITGWIDPDGFTDGPLETINYISAHDNLTLWDRIARSLPDPKAQERAVRLGGAAVLLAQGIPFLEGGAQIGRTKGGNGNSYNAGDEVNAYYWARGRDYADLNEYYKGLIAIRRANPAFRLMTADQVRRDLRFVPLAASNTIAWTLRQGTTEFMIVLNGGATPLNVPVEGKPWKVIANHQRAGNEAFGIVSGKVRVEPLSALVLRR